MRAKCYSFLSFFRMNKASYPFNRVAYRTSPTFSRKQSTTGNHAIPQSDFDNSYRLSCNMFRQRTRRVADCEHGMREAPLSGTEIAVSSATVPTETFVFVC